MSAKLWMSAFFLLMLLSACSSRNNASIELVGINYTDSWITTFSVDGYQGHGIEPDGGGGKFVCCVNIPRKWHKDMQVTVRWSANEHIPDLWKERVVAVPKYTKQDISTFAVHFYPDDNVKVLVTSKTIRYPDYPYPRKK